MPVLEFKGKSAVVNHHYTVPHHRLELVPELSCLGTKDAPRLDGNLIVEGDNLLALKALLPTHAGKVKCVYIDPPYNTGNEGWVYNDNLTQPQFKEWIGKTVGKESEDACRHDKWCCMMYPRLQLLRELMRDDGAIFVSIDDNEVHHLRMVMDEVFGVDCFVATFIWQKRYSRENRGPAGTVHDYVVVYTRTPDTFKGVRNKLLPSDESRAVYKNPNNDPRGDWRPVPMTAQGTRKNQMYKITAPGGKVHEPPKGRCWSIVEDEFLQLRNASPTRIWFGVDGNAQPNTIRYWDEVEGFVPWTWWPHDEVGHTDEAKKELFEFFAKDDVFDSPKPTRLLRRILDIYTTPESGDIVLDSFAGSGTTAHALLKLNAEDGGSRRFVLIQLPCDSKEHEANGSNICQNITAERVRKTIRGYVPATTEGKPKPVPGLGGSFTYARLGPPLLTDLRDFGETYPPYDELAKYVFYTETSRQFDRKDVDRATGRIGTVGRTDYFLLYDADPKVDVALDMEWLKRMAPAAKKRALIVYCEKFWFHRDDLWLYEKENSCTVRPMLVPFQLR